MPDQGPEGDRHLRLEAELFGEKIPREATQGYAQLCVFLTTCRAVRSRQLRAAVEAARRSGLRAQPSPIHSERIARRWTQSRARGRKLLAREPAVEVGADCGPVCTLCFGARNGQRSCTASQLGH